METLAYRASSIIAAANESDVPGCSDWLHDYTNGALAVELLISACDLLLSIGGEKANELAADIEDQL